MKILITGGAGFFGLHCALYFSKKKYKVILIDIADFRKQEYPKGCMFVRADVRNFRSMLHVIENADVIIHAAGALPLCTAKEIHDTNVGGTKNILEAAKRNRVKQVVYISSTAVYGVPKKHPIFENDPLVGVGPYGQSKIDSENLCMEYRKKGLLITIIRPKTFVGTHRLGVFEILFDWVNDGKRIPVLGSGNNRYQLLDVEDLTDAIVRLITLKDKKKSNDTFNIGALKYKTVRKDLQELFDYAKSGSAIQPTPAWLIRKALRLFEKLKLSPLYQWVYDTADKDSFVSIDHLTSTLKWKPKYSNADALIRSYRWYEEHYKDVKSRPTGVTHTVGWKQGILGVFKKML